MRTRNVEIVDGIIRRLWPFEACAPGLICELPPSHSGPCRSRGTVDEDAWMKHCGETEDGIRDLAIVDRYYARDDLSDVGLI
jgi:hypothetical protein